MTSLTAYFNLSDMAANQTLGVNLQTKETPLIVSYLNLVLINSITPTLFDDYQQCPHSGNFTSSTSTHPSIPNVRISTAAFPAYTTLLHLGQQILHSPSNNFLLFQLNCGCYVNDR